MIRSPLFRKMSLWLAYGKVFQVVAENQSPDNVYIKSARLNGRSLDAPVIRYSDILGGSVLEFRMGAKPSR